MTINLELHLTSGDIEDIVVTALEGGIGYWACLDNTTEEFDNAPEDEPVSITASKILLDGDELRFIDVENGDEYVLSLGLLMDGIKKFWLLYDYNGVIKNGVIDAVNLDANDADTIFQCAMFGDVEFA